MALVQITLRALQCDGCRKLYQDGRNFEIGQEARALAYIDGWRFVPKLTANGLLSRNTNDVCPECIPTFKQRLDGSHKSGR